MPLTQCDTCGSDDVVIIEWDEETILYECEDCGNQFTEDV